MIRRLWRWFTQPQPKPKPHAEKLMATYRYIERDEHSSLVEVKSSRGTFQYRIPNGEPLHLGDV